MRTKWFENNINLAKFMHLKQRHKIGETTAEDGAVFKQHLLLFHISHRKQAFHDDAQIKYFESMKKKKKYFIHPLFLC